MISNIYFGYGFALLIPQEMGIDNPYVNGMLIGIADLIGFTIVFFFIEKFSRKSFNLFTVMAIIVCSAFLLLIGFVFNRHSSAVKNMETILSGKHTIFIYVIFLIISLYKFTKKIFFNPNVVIKLKSSIYQNDDFGWIWIPFWI